MSNNKTKKELVETVVLNIYSNNTIQMLSGTPQKSKTISLVKFCKNIKDIAKQIPDKDKDILNFLAELGIEQAELKSFVKENMKRNQNSAEEFFASVFNVCKPPEKFYGCILYKIDNKVFFKYHPNTNVMDCRYKDFINQLNKFSFTCSIEYEPFLIKMIKKYFKLEVNRALVHDFR